MIKKTIGTVLILVAAVIVVVLLTSGGPLLPHAIGPTVLAVVGATLVILPQKAD